MSAPIIRRLADVQPERVRWLWPGRIARGKLTILDGDPGLGKSAVTLDSGGATDPGRYQCRMGSHQMLKKLLASFC